jgi:hypothetical protein
MTGIKLSNYSKKNRSNPNYSERKLTVLLRLCPRTRVSPKITPIFPKTTLFLKLIHLGLPSWFHQLLITQITTCILKRKGIRIGIRFKFWKDKKEREAQFIIP